MGHVLEVAIHLIAHVIDYLLAYPCAYVAFQHAYYLGARKGEEGKANKLDKKAHVGTNQRLIHYVSGDDAGEQTHHAGCGNGAEHQKKLGPVRLKIAAYALEQGRGDGGHVELFLVGEEASGA